MPVTSCTYRRDLPQARLDREIKACFLLNGHGDIIVLVTVQIIPFKLKLKKNFLERKKS